MTSAVVISIEYITGWGESLILRVGTSRFAMSWTEGHIWRAEVPVEAFHLEEMSELTFSFELVRGGEVVRREWRCHSLDEVRAAMAGVAEGRSVTLRTGWLDKPEGQAVGLPGPFRPDSQAAGSKAHPWRGAGVAVPVFSLRSEESFGIGEFHDLKKLADWAAATGMKVIQILPVNDTTMGGDWKDSYPYNANSSFALHPQYLHLPEVGISQNQTYEKLQKELNSLPQVDYERVNREKNRLLLEYFSKKGKAIVRSDEYRQFVKENEYWLPSYMAYCVRRDGTAPEEFYGWEQFLLDRQLKDAADYARSRGVILKGDLPIGVSASSADVWAWPTLFHTDSQAGAPPDAFAEDGQNWGFPTYDWEAMSADGFLWWKNRLRKMSRYFDAFRIDHILGFFRIWEIPSAFSTGLMGHFSPALPLSKEELLHKGFDISRGRYVKPRKGRPESDVLFIEDPGKKGFWHPRIAAQNTLLFKELAPEMQAAYNELYDDFFYRRHNAFWKASAYAKLPDLLSSTSMLPCGEDLGMIPPCVPETMDELGILSLEIQRMPKEYGVKLGDTSRYPYNCVCATGTHDMDTLRSWWAKEGWELSGYAGSKRPEDASPEICEAFVREHLDSPAMLCILPLQDWLAIDGGLRYQGNPDDERINVPAVSRHYWRYRMHLTLEDLTSEKAFSEKIRSMVTSSGRNF